MKKSDQTINEDLSNYLRLGRENFFLEFLSNLYESVDQQLHLALCGSWGSGKTFFIHKIISSVPEERNIESFYLSAWENDYFESPLVALLKSLAKDKEFEKAFLKVIRFKKKIQPDISVNVPFVSFALKVKSLKSDIYSNFKTSSEIQDIFEKTLTEYCKEKKKKIFLFIDDLDRCRPDFSIELLEITKHVVNSEITFIYSIEFEQLCASINSYYGNDYNSSLYLYKIFDEIITLPEITAEGFQEYIKIRYGNISRNLSLYYYNLIEAYNLSLRDINRWQNYWDRICNLYVDGFPAGEEICKDLIIALSMVRVKYPLTVRMAFNSKDKISDLVQILSKSPVLLNKISAYNKLHSSVFRLEDLIDFIIQNSQVKLSFY